MKSLSLRHRVLAGCLAFAAFAPCARQALADGWKNLKVLPRTISRDGLKANMKAINRDLGVDCDHCHDDKDMAKDLPKKIAGRALMKLTADLNARYFKTATNKVSCGTCHRGKAEPEPYTP